MSNDKQTVQEFLEQRCTDMSFLIGLLYGLVTAFSKSFTPEQNALIDLIEQRFNKLFYPVKDDGA